MNTEIRPPLHAALSYTILIVAFIAIFEYLILPALDSRNKIVQSTLTLQEQNSRFLTAINDYEKTIESQSNQTTTIDDTEFAESFLHASTSALAAAQLQSLLRDLIKEIDAELVSATFKRRDEESAFPIITVNIRLRASVVALQQFLYKVETGTPALFVENLVVQSRHRIGREIRSSKDELEIRLDVTGYLDIKESNQYDSN